MRCHLELIFFSLSVSIIHLPISTSRELSFFLATLLNVLSLHVWFTLGCALALALSLGCIFFFSLSPSLFLSDHPGGR